DRLPGRFVGPERLAAKPWHLRRGLAAGVADLDADRVRRDPAVDLHRARHRRVVMVAVESGTTVRDAALARHVGLLDDEESRARARHAAEMGEMPIGHAAVVGRGLAHRRDDQTIGQGDAAELDRREEFRGHGSYGVATEIPCCAKAARSALANATAPGWSPCRQSVPGATGTRLPAKLVTMP